MRVRRIRAFPSLLTTLSVAISPALAQCPSNWSLAASTGPTVRNYPGLAYDSTRDITLLYGGGGASSSVKADFWKWDGSIWTQLQTTAAAGARRAHGMCYDRSRDRMVVFGGVTSSGINGDTWEWNGSIWNQVAPVGITPAARGFMPLVYDAQAGVCILHGGWSGGTVYQNDMWSYNGAGWTQITPASGTPSARGFHAMAYDAARQRLVLFGGLFISGSTSYYGDTWEWDGSIWTNVSSLTGPAPRAYHTMTYDSIRHRVLLYGGFSFEAGTFGDTWEWDGETWTQLAPSNAPVARQNQGMAYDELHQLTMIFGGNNGSTLRNDTWTLSTDAPAHIETPPSAASACVGDNAGFTLFATGTDLTYEWSRNGAPLYDGPTGFGSTISGATSDSLSINNVVTSDAGQYTCSVFNICGADTSAPLALTVIAGDLDSSGTIDLGDLANVLAHYGQSGATYSDGDLTGDTIVDLADIAALLASYGLTCP